MHYLPQPFGPPRTPSSSSPAHVKSTTLFVAVSTPPITHSPRPWLSPPSFASHPPYVMYVVVSSLIQYPKANANTFVFRFGPTRLLQDITDQQQAILFLCQAHDNLARSKAPHIIIINNNTYVAVVPSSGEEEGGLAIRTVPDSRNPCPVLSDISTLGYRFICSGSRSNTSVHAFLNIRQLVQVLPLSFFLFSCIPLIIQSGPISFPGGPIHI